MPIDHELLGEIIRNERERRRLSQEALAALADLSRTYLGEIERGTAVLSFSSLASIAEGLGMPLSEIVGIYEKQLAEGS